VAKRIRVGDVLAIPLNKGRFAFCRVLKDACIGVYRHVAARKEAPPPPDTEYLFVVGVYRDVLTSGQWPLVARVPFESEEEAWPPPHVVRDPIDGKCSIYHHGQMRPAAPTECDGLEEAAVWEKEEILDRIREAALQGDLR
jgi:hypothetical protein